MPGMRSHLHPPRTRTGWLLTAATAALVAVIAFLATYLTLFRGSSLAPLALSQSTATAGPSLAASQLPGSWTVASGSVAGYRVREQLAFVSAPGDAVGRTTAVSGSVTLTGTANALVVSTASFKVDVSKLTSDDSRRDDHLRSLGIQTDQYPTTTFVLTSPIVLPATATDGAAFKVSGTGELTIHGTTRPVTIPITARVNGSLVELVGSITFPFEQFGMTPPNVFGFVSVVDSATMEFDIRLQHA
jgi:polyisoprenoid-binding protein YceI